MLETVTRWRWQQEQPNTAKKKEKKRIKKLCWEQLKKEPYVHKVSLNTMYVPESAARILIHLGLEAVFKWNKIRSKKKKKWTAEGELSLRGALLVCRAIHGLHHRLAVGPWKQIWFLRFVVGFAHELHPCFYSFQCWRTFLNLKHYPPDRDIYLLALYSPSCIFFCFFCVRNTSNSLKKRKKKKKTKKDKKKKQEK